MNEILNKTKNYLKGFTDALVIGTAVVCGVAYYHEKKENDILREQLEEQQIIIQRFGWPKTRTEMKNTKVPKGNGVSYQKPSNPIGFY